MTTVSPDQLRSTLIKQINYLFRNPSLSPAQREEVNQDLQKIVVKLENFEKTKQVPKK